MRKQWRLILKRATIGGLLLLVSTMPWKDVLLSLTLSNKNLDLIWVLFAMILPNILRFIALGVLASAAFFAIKMVTLPRSFIEKEMYRLKKRKIIKNLIYSLLVLVLLLFPTLSGTHMSQVLNTFFGSLPWLLPIYLPFYFFYYADLLLLLEALIVSFFLVHLIKMLSVEFSTIKPDLTNTVFEEGKEIKFKILMESKLPLLPYPRLPFKASAHVKSNLLKTKHELEVVAKLPMGYYRFDVLKFEIASMPFFFSTYFKTSTKPVEITVLPKIKVKNVLYNKNPFQIRETGDLIKRVSGSSLEFAGIKEFSPGDPISKIWWKGLAKGGKMLKKDFFSLAEDRWILVIDLSNPLATKEEEAALLAFSRAFIETFTRKDIEISVHLISPNYSYAKYSTKKKELLSFLVRHWSDFRSLSHDGARAVLKDAVGSEVEEIEDRCKHSGISLSSFLFYSGLLKESKSVFEWSRKYSFDSSIKGFMKNMTKSGKILVLTPGMTENMVDEIIKVAKIKHSQLLFASFDKVPKAKTYVIPKVNPEKVVWRLMYA
ncbi:MAG: DUF58 domain-containing protein [Candidatus Altiarchaeota archaeon]|nr:DUF58 domain-containing protein [Candidatus Altiarchaeota archaeon]